MTRRAAAAAVGVALLAIAVHVRLLDGTYIQDDQLAVEHNPIVARGRPSEIFASSYWAHARGDDRSLYRPLTILSFAAERAAQGGLHAPSSRAINITLHALAAVALLGLGWRLGAGPLAAGVAAALFAVHPVHVEAIASIVGRAELLAALFSFSAIGLVTYAVDWGPTPAAGARPFAAVAAGLSLFLALAAKESAAATPVLMAVLLGIEGKLFHARTSRWLALKRRALALVPAAAAAATYLLLRWHALGSPVPRPVVAPFDNPLVSLTGIPHLATALGLVARSLRLLVVPVPLSADYAGPTIGVEPSLLAPRPLLALLLLAAFAVRAVLPWLPGRRTALDRWLLSAAAWMFLLPYLVIGNLLFDTGTIFAERLLYLPSAGFCLLLGVLALRIARRGATARAGALAVAIGLTAVFGWLSWQRSGDWRDEETLFRAAIRANPRAARSLYVLGASALARGDLPNARTQLERSVALWPAYAAARVPLGVVLAREGRLDDAAGVLREAVRLGPERAEAHLALALTLRRLGRPDEAEASLRRSLAIDPGSATAWAELGNLELEQRRPEAAAAYRRAIALGRVDLTERLRLAEPLERRLE